MKKIAIGVLFVVLAIFGLLAVAAIGIFLVCVGIGFTGIGKETAFYQFFDDGVKGAAILIGAGLVGVGVSTLAVFLLRKLGVEFNSTVSEGTISGEQSSNESSDDYSGSDSNDSSSSSTYPYEYLTATDQYGNTTEITHNTVTGTYTDNLGNEYTTFDGSDFQRVDDD